MDRDSILAKIEHESAELRARYPHVHECIPALAQWTEGEQPRYSLGLDIRWPQHQALVSGPAHATAEAAVEAAFRLARERAFAEHVRRRD
ncbi:MAG: hypothetical protein ACT4P3_02510 [Betaproteobacteria bacterium]